MTSNYYNDIGSSKRDIAGFIKKYTKNNGPYTERLTELINDYYDSWTIISDMIHNLGFLEETLSESKSTDIYNMIYDKKGIDSRLWKTMNKIHDKANEVYNKALTWDDMFNEIKSYVNEIYSNDFDWAKKNGLVAIYQKEYDTNKKCSIKSWYWKAVNTPYIDKNGYINVEVDDYYENTFIYDDSTKNEEHSLPDIMSSNTYIIKNEFDYNNFIENVLPGTR